MGLSQQQQQMATLIYGMGRKAGLPENRALELVAAAYAESGLNPSIRNKTSGAAGLFQLLSPGYVQRAHALGGVDNPTANTQAILGDYVNYWHQHPNAAPGAAGRDVEKSGEGASFYSNPLALLGKQSAAGGSPSGGGAVAAAPPPAMTGGANLQTLRGNLAMAMQDASNRVARGDRADFSHSVEPALFGFADAANADSAASTVPEPPPGGTSDTSKQPSAIEPTKMPKGSSKVDSRLVALAHQYGLKITSGYRSAEKNQAVGGAPSSYHLAGQAIDVQPSPNAKAFLDWAFHHPHFFAEVFYDPAGMFIKDGKLYHGQIGGHGDHVHIAVKG